ncbi:MAG TPA: MarR family transcriptional regulator [Streptosporangiaceae bacterium]
MNEPHYYAGVDAGAGASERAFERLIELAVVTFEFMERGLVERGLSRARATVLWSLRRRGAMTQRELADAIGVTPRNVTGLVDALEADGFVVRERHPADRRAMLVTLTDKGVTAVVELEQEYRDASGRLFGGLPGDAMDGFLLTVEQLIERIRHENH